MRKALKETKRVVVKVGTSTLTYENGKLNLRRIEQLVRVLSDLKNRGMEVILVSSGAIGVGVGKLGLKHKPTITMEKQAAAAVGQCELMYLYDKIFSEYGYSTAQVLLTKDVIENKERKQNVVNTFITLLRMDVVPVVNENDAISVEEIEFGDNDTLSAVVACLTDSETLVILTDIDGLYSENPKENPDAELISDVYEINEDLKKIAGGAGSNRGTGGMITKVMAAEIATKSGIHTVVCNGADPGILYSLFDGENVGTVFHA
ncbi:MAG: glutamate 5-kinase [Clostridia bacterium]|nr:glutamate 5-kinase [Clostridia bacterium]